MYRWYALAGFALTAAAFTCATHAGEKTAKDNTPPAGFTALFNGKDLTNWQGLVEINKRKKMSKEQYADALKKANEKYLPHWKVVDGVLAYDGKGQSLQTVKDYANFELYVDWKIESSGDSGVYLRGNPQVQIWDIKGKNNKAGIGSGGLYNNQKKGANNPIAVGDNPAGQWNTFHIHMVGDIVTINLTGKLVVNKIALENYWERGQPLPTRGPIELQHHGDHLWFKNIYVKELPD